MDFDDAYANAAYIPGAAAYPERWRQNAADFATGCYPPDRQNWI